MKARIKATGEEIEVMQVYEKGDSFYVRLDMLSTTEIRYHINELEFEGIELPNQSESDYWDKLLHQYAGMAMQGILANIDLLMSLANKKAADYPAKYTVAEFAKDCATALVEKLKEK